MSNQMNGVKKSRIAKTISAVTALTMAIILVLPMRASAANDARSYNSRFSNKYQTIIQAGYNTNVTRTPAGEGYTTTVTYTDNTTDTEIDDETVLDMKKNEIPRTIRIAVGEYTDLQLRFINGVSYVDEPDSSNDEIVRAWERSSYVNSNPYDKTQYCGYDQDQYGNENYYYYSEKGDKIYVGYYSNLPTASSVDYTMRLYGNKAGKAKITLSATNDDGRETEYKINVVVTEAMPFKSITFGNKSLWYDSEIGGNNSNYIYAKKQKFSLKNSGKLKVRMNDGYDIEKIEIGTLYNESVTAPFGAKTEDFNGTTTEEDGTVVTRSYSGVSQMHAVDLNGDGDTLDTVNGMSESCVIFRMKKFGNNKNLTLSKVSPLENYESGTEAMTWTYTDGTTGETKKVGSTKNENLAPTLVRITFYDEVENRNYIYETVIYRRIRK